METPVKNLVSILPVLALAVGGAAGVCHAQTSTYTFTTLAGTAGSVIRSADGTGSAAQFYSPRGVAVDSAGNLFVADSSNNTIRKITAAGVVTTFAGTAGSQGNTDGAGSAARFIDPYAVAADSAGNLYVADTSGNSIRKISSTGVVTTLAGGLAAGSADGTGTAARFWEPRGIAVDLAGNVYVADYMNNTVRKITSAGLVTTFAGTAGAAGSADGTGPAAAFRGLAGVAVDGTGNVYVADTGNGTIRRITPTGVVTTLAGQAGSSSIVDGTGTAARFSQPRGIAVDGAGNIYVADYNGHTIRRVTSTGVVTTLAGTAAAAGATDATGSAARFYAPSGLAVDGAGNVFVADTSNNTVRKVTSAGVVTTLAGLAGRSSSADGTGGAARFEDPYSVAVDAGGNTYIADATDHTVRKITPAGVVTTLAGTAGSFGSADGTGSAARFFAPFGIAVDAAGTVYLADTGNFTIRRITAAGVVTTLAGSAGSAGNVDATGTTARFSRLNGLTVDGAGNVTVVDGDTIRRVTPAGVVTTLAGSSGSNGFVNGTGSAARFLVPFDVSVDSAGNVYVCDHGNHAIRKVTSAGVVTTLAGSGSPGKADGTGTSASFKFPSGIAVDGTGTVFVADTDNQVIRRITADGVVTTIGGGSSPGSTDGVGTAARFFNPKDVAVDGSGNLYVADRGNHTVRKGTAAGSLVGHFYRSILRREPDAGGQAYWDGEAARVQALGVNVNEVWYAMAGSFFASPEYLAFNRDSDGFVTDLYTTFFNRAPDAGGFADWKAQLAAGMPREVVLASFMFSAEFASFTQALFGTTSTRKEVDTVVDFYRGLLGVLPDSSGFNYWLGLFRAAQCQGGNAVNTQVETISSAFANSTEYNNRGRTNAQYVGDLYNAFLRRGAPGDNAGVQFWINQIATGARSRANVRQAFVASTEFQSRVAAIINQGCLQ